MAEKPWQYRRCLIFDELSSLYQWYMAIFAHSPNQCHLSTTLGCWCVGQLMHFQHIFYSWDWLSVDWAHISLSTISKTREINHTLQQSSGYKFIKGKHTSFLGGYKLTLRLKITVALFGSCNLRTNLITLQLPPFI